MPYQELILDRKDHVAVVTFNRPDRLNALNRTLRDEIIQVCEEARVDDDVWAVVFTGAGNRGFCSGADISGEGGGEAQQPRNRQELMDEYHWVGVQAITVYQRLDKPTVAAINGVAAGAGMSLALACDVRVGCENSRFKTVFLERNLSTDSGMSYFLPRIVGISHALDLVMSSRFVDAEEAYRIGLLNRLVSADKLVDEAVDVAKQMSSWPPVATQMAKRVLQHSLGASLEDQLRFELHGLGISRLARNDGQESAAARRERREPHFTGT